MGSKRSCLIQAKAFDKVDYNILLAKVKRYREIKHSSKIGYRPY